MTEQPAFQVALFPPLDQEICQSSQVFKMIDEGSGDARMRDQQEPLGIVPLKGISYILHIALPDSAPARLT